MPTGKPWSPGSTRPPREGRLTLTEFTERSGLAYAARTQAELEPLVADLPAAAGHPPARRHRRGRAALTPVGSVKRSGRWRLDRDTLIRTVVGSIKLDLSAAEIAAPEVELRVQTTVGSVKIWVPRGIRVEVTGHSAVGSRQVDDDGSRPAPVRCCGCTSTPRSAASRSTAPEASPGRREPDQRLLGTLHRRRRVGVRASRPPGRS